MHEYFHTKFGFCMWDVGALAILAAMVIILAVHIVRHRKRERDFADELSEKMASASHGRGDKK